MALRFLADENIELALIRAVRRDPSIDIVRAQDEGLSGADDEAVLAWAAADGRVLITHDVDTMPRYARDRAADGSPMPGVIEIPQPYNIGRVADELTLLAHCSREGEWEGRVAYFSR